MYSLLVILYLMCGAQAQWGSNFSGTCQTPDQKPGFCILPPSCKTMAVFLSKLPKPLSAEIKNKLREYHCGFTVSRKPKICCPTQAINILTPNSNNQSDEELDIQFADVSNHRNIDLLPKDCGHLDTVNKIVGGNKTGIFEFPWMALLAYESVNGIGFKCGGTILNENYILTAAHCVTNLRNNKLRLIGVRVGEHNINTANDCEEYEDGTETCAPPFEDLSIVEVTPHDSYNTETNINDIALIRVSPIDLSRENSRPVCLPLDNLGNINYSNKVVITGWGVTDNFKSSPELLKAELDLVRSSECQKKYGNRKLLSSQLCAGGNSNSDSCAGDSGGPLHTYALHNGETRYIQQGIVSFGPRECGKVPLPGVYTRVASYLDWILDNMRS